MELVFAGVAVAGVIYMYHLKGKKLRAKEGYLHYCPESRLTRGEIGLRPLADEAGGVTYTDKSLYIVSPPAWVAAQETLDRMGIVPARSGYTKHVSGDYGIDSEYIP